MRRLLVFVCLAVGLVLPVAPVHAATVVSRNLPLTGTVEACGETITLTATTLVVFTAQPLGDDGFLGSFHVQQQGSSGTSLSGANYRGTGLTRETTVGVPSGGLTTTFIDRFRLVGTAGAPTLSITATYHLTVTPTGEVTANVANFGLECV